MKIDPGIEICGHVPPYRRIDPMHPGRKRRITMEEAMTMVMSGGREPDPAIYFFDGILKEYILKEGI